MFLVPLALAAADTGTIVVTVTDQYGTPLPGATCLLEGPWPTFADDRGQCTFAGLAPRSGYDIQIQRRGSPTVRKVNLTVAPGTTTRTSVQLRQGRAFGGFGAVRLVLTDYDGERLPAAWCELHGYPLGAQERTVDAVDGECVFEDVPGGQFYWAVARAERGAAALLSFTVRANQTVSAWLVPTSFVVEFRGEALGAPPPDPDRPSRFTIVTAGHERAQLDLRRAGRTPLALVPGRFPHGATVYVDGVRRISR